MSIGSLSEEECTEDQCVAMEGCVAMCKAREQLLTFNIVMERNSIFVAADYKVHKEVLKFQCCKYKVHL